MKNKFILVMYTSIRRRKRTIRRVSIVAFFASFFVLLTLLYQDNMDLYQNRANQLKYGEWFLSETTNGEESAEYLRECSYFDGYGFMQKGPLIDQTSCYIGWADQRIQDVGHMSLLEGTMPQADDEIAMELDVLAELGLGSNLNQQITLSLRTSDGEKITKVYRLTGILANYTLFWANGSQLPSALVTQSEFESYDTITNNIYMYLLKDQVVLNNKGKYVEELSNMIQEQLIYNGNIEKTSVWGNQVSYQQIIIILLLISISALVYMYISYINGRRKEYYRFRCLGVSMNQLRGFMIFEGLYACIPGIIAGLICGILGSFGFGLLFQRTYRTEFLIFIKLSSVLLSSISVIAAAIFPIIIVTLSMNEKRIYENTKTIPIKKLRKIRCNKLTKRNLYRSFRKREIKIYPLRTILIWVLSLTVATAVLLCCCRIKNEYALYQRHGSRFHDYQIDKIDEDVVLSLQNTDKKIKRSERRSRLDLGVDDHFFEEMSQLSGLKKVDRITVDNSVTITWDGIEDSDIRKLQIENDREAKEVDEYPENWYLYGSCFYEDAKQVYEEFRNNIDPNYYDPEAFARGEQVIYQTENVQMNSFKKGFSVKEPVKENTLHTGDKVTYETVDGPVEAVVVALVYEKNEKNLYSSTGFYSYEFIGSSALGQRIAASDHRSYKYNLAFITMNGKEPFRVVNNHMTNLFEKYELSYGSGYEKKLQYYNAFQEKAFLFTIIILIIIVVYLIIYANIITARMEYKRMELNRLRWLGVSRSKLIRKELLSYALENIVIVIALPLVILLNLYSTYHYMNTSGDVWIGYYDQMSGEWSTSKAGSLLQTVFTNKISILWFCIALIVLFFLLYMVAIIPVLRSLRKNTNFDQM